MSSISQSLSEFISGMFTEGPCMAGLSPAGSKTGSGGNFRMWGLVIRGRCYH